MAATYSSLVGLAVGGKYEIRRVLGAGGMGVVCEAVHLDLGKKVAVKLIDKSMKESELIVARFRREARATGQINSEHIVDVFDVGADARVGLYMVMELLRGEDLQSRLERDKKLDVKTGVMIAHQIARGLAKAHEAGIIHRDLKPANVFLTEREDGKMLVKLLDFGVSKLLLEAPGSARITGTGAPIGTPLYMAPEQGEGKDDIDVRADVWSLGAVLYEAFAGAAPFSDRGSYHGTIIGILTSRPRLLHDVAPWIPPQVAAVVDAMLVHDKLARLPSAQAVTQRLLDAFPTVLPDGTGKYTAVIVPHTAGSIDATGDTEVFNAASFAAARANRNLGSVPPTDPSRRRPSRPPPADSLRTLEATDPRPSESRQTGAATSVEASPYSQPFATAPPIDRPVRERARTEPLPPGSGFGRSPVSSGSGMALPPPSTLPSQEPVGARAPSFPTPPRERGRGGALLVIALVVVVVAVRGFMAGPRASPGAAPPTPPPVTTTAPSHTPSAAPMSIMPATSAHEPPAVTTVETATATAASVVPTATAPPPPPRKRKPRPVAPRPEPTPEEVPSSPE